MNKIESTLPSQITNAPDCGADQLVPDSFVSAIRAMCPGIDTDVPNDAED